MIIIFLLVVTIAKLEAQSNVCTPNLCGVNGNCEISNNIAVCVCKQGFVGSRCQAEDLCSVTKRPCGANGACFPIIQSQTIAGQVSEQVSYHCQCYSGFYGQNCEFAPALPCTSSPCLNGGSCVNRNNTVDYYCICLGTYTGKNCGTYIDGCAFNLCSNDALCIPPNDLHQNYTCSCRNGFYGQYCENEINECDPNNLGANPCQNGGTCYDLVDAYYCECNGPYGGSNCETSLFIGSGNDLDSLLLPVILPAIASSALLPIIPAAVSYLLLRNQETTNQDNNPCNSNPCGTLVGSVCEANTTLPNGYICRCADGFFGSPCQPNPCTSNPCRQPNSQCIPVDAGGIITNFPGCTCSNPIATYVCVCPSNFPPFASIIC